MKSTDCRTVVVGRNIQYIELTLVLVPPVPHGRAVGRSVGCVWFLAGVCRRGCSERVPYRSCWRQGAVKRNYQRFVSATWQRPSPAPPSFHGLNFILDFSMATVRGCVLIDSALWLDSSHASLSERAGERESAADRGRDEDRDEPYSTSWRCRKQLLTLFFTATIRNRYRYCYLATRADAMKHNTLDT